MKRIIKLIVILSILTVSAPLANAMSQYLFIFNNTYPAAASTIGMDCTLCHAVTGGGGPPNSYGTDYAGHGYSFSDIEQLDSDNDGYSNILEIQALTYPGDPTSHPANTDFVGTPTTGPSPLTVSFAAAIANSPTAWSWDFGDGSTSTLQNPVHTYMADGSFTVSLIATGPGGAVQTIKNNYINVAGVCGLPPVKIAGTFHYDISIQNAYNLMANIAGSIQIQAFEFTEDLKLDHQLNVALKGGYNCDYTSNLGVTTVHGTMTISGGTVTIENLILR